MRGTSAGARGRALPRPSSRQRNLSSAEGDEPKASAAAAAAAASAALPLLSSSSASTTPSTSAGGSPYHYPSSPTNANNANNNSSGSNSSSRNRRRALLVAALWTVLGLWLLSTSSTPSSSSGRRRGGFSSSSSSSSSSSRKHGPASPQPPQPPLSPPAALAARVDALAAWAGPELLRPALRIALSARELRLASLSSSSTSSSSSSSSSSSTFSARGGNGTATKTARRASSNSSSYSAAAAFRRRSYEDDVAAARAAVVAALASSPDGDEELSLALGLDDDSSSPSSESLKAFEEARAELSAVLSAAAAAAGGSGGSGSGSGGSFSQTPLLACPLDPTLPPSAAAKGGPVLIAADVSNAELVAPHLVVQAVHLLALLPRGRAFLSVYESGSSDSTREWLLLAKALTSALGAPSRVVAGGKLERRQGQDRIEFLAEARNRALQPLWSEEGTRREVFGGEGEEGEGGMNEDEERSFSFDGNETDAEIVAFSSKPRKTRKDSETTRRSGAAASASGGWPATRVLFLNDVFFCASDALRLLAHVDPSAGPEEGRVDLSCGLDFDRPRLQDAPLDEQIDLWVSRLARRWRPFPPFFLPLPRSVLALAPRLWPRALLGEWKKEGGAADAEFQSKAELQFYDIWVARDALGGKFEKRAPHVSDPYSFSRASRGLPFPVKCCWNGLVAMDAGPFVGRGEVGGGRREWREKEKRRRKKKVELNDDDFEEETSSSSSSPALPSFPPLRFRAAGKGECAASECSLLCNDLLRRGAKGLETEAEAEAEREREEEEEKRKKTSSSSFSSSPSSSYSSFLLRRAAPARMLVDPGVRVAYTLADAAHLRLRDRVRGLSSTRSWAEISQAPAIDWGDSSNYLSSPSSSGSSSSPPPRVSLGAPSLADPAWEACCLKPGADAIVWSEDCGWDSWREPSSSSSLSSLSSSSTFSSSSSSSSSSGFVAAESFLGSGAAKRRREAGFSVDESVTVVGRDEGDEEEDYEVEEEEALLPPPRK